MFLRKSRESRKDSAVRSAIEASRPARAAGRERGTSDQGARDVQGGRRRQPWPSAAASSAAVGSVSSRPRRRRRGWGGGGEAGCSLPPAPRFPCALGGSRLARAPRNETRRQGLRPTDPNARSGARRTAPSPSTEERSKAAKHKA